MKIISDYKYDHTNVNFLALYAKNSPFFFLERTGLKHKKWLAICLQLNVKSELSVSVEMVPYFEIVIISLILSEI